MSVVRRFLVAPSLVRLIRKERGGSRVMEGYFAPQAGRTSFVRVEGADCHLILVTTDAEGRPKEEWTEVPRAHGDALLDVCSGKASYERTTVPLGGRDAVIDRYVTPAGLDLVSVAFDDAGAAQGFAPPAWFGSEVSADAAYERHAVALSGVPAAGEIGLSNPALDAVLDLIEPRFGFGSLRKPPAAEARSPAPPPAAPPPAPKLPEPQPVAEAPPASPAEPAPVAEIPQPPAEPASATEAPPPAAAPPEDVAPPVEPAPAAAETKPADPPPAAAPAEATIEAKPESKPVPEKAAEDKADARIDDVIESLSAALSAAIQQPREPAQDEDGGAPFERWTVRPRRTNQQS